MPATVVAIHCRTVTKRAWDPFLVVILATLVFAALLPVQGRAGEVFSWVTWGAIFLLFFGYGTRLSTAQAWEAVKHWKLHLVILAFTFVTLPLIGIGLLQLPLLGVSSAVAVGLAFLTIVPSTVQSSITFTSIAGGNIPGAMVSATASNLLGVVLTPVLAIAILPEVGGVPITWDSLVSVAVQMLLPFVLGQVLRPLLRRFLEPRRKQLKFYDQFVIVLVVYGAFSSFFATGVWREVSVVDLLVMTGIALVVLAFMLWLTWWLGGRLRFNRADRIAILMCGTKKSLATGVPIASVLFTASAVGVIVLPLMIFHQAQLMACSAIASRLSRDAEPQA